MGFFTYYYERKNIGYPKNMKDATWDGKAWYLEDGSDPIPKSELRRQALIAIQSGQVPDAYRLMEGSWFEKMYEKQKPIIWSPFENFAKLIQNQKGFIWDIDEPVFKTIIPEYDKLEIRGETNGKIEDRHYGRYGNYYMAVVFDTILRYTENINHDGYYIKDDHLTGLIVSDLQKNKCNF